MQKESDKVSEVELELEPRWEASHWTAAEISELGELLDMAKMKELRWSRVL